MALSRQTVQSTFATIVGRNPAASEIDRLVSYAEDAHISQRQLLAVLGASGEVVRADLDNSMELHLFALHRARLALMATVLPPARHILDLGGANAPLHECGYPYDFDDLTIVDLPPTDRHTEFADRVLQPRESDKGRVQVLYSSMTDLSAVPADSIDLVWSGESVEHITREEARLMYKEIRRILRPDGSFCLDTPNALVTRIHSPIDLIHADHKIEYTPAELVADLRHAGFAVIRSLGVCEMQLTLEAGEIDYRDFLVGAGLSSAVDRCYIQYHHCRPSVVGGCANKRLTWRDRDAATATRHLDAIRRGLLNDLRDFAHRGKSASSRFVHAISAMSRTRSSKPRSKP